MFTTGSKLFLGATVLSIVAAVVFGASKGGSDGWLGVIGLLSAALVFAFLFGVNYYAHDGNVSAMSDNATTESPAGAAAGRAQHVARPRRGGRRRDRGRCVSRSRSCSRPGSCCCWPPPSSGWCRAGASGPRAIRAYNAGLRKRMLHPLEFPVLAAAGLAAIIYSFSRIMLWIDKSGGPVVFIIAGALVLFGGFLFASRPSLKKGSSPGSARSGRSAWSAPVP